MAIRRPRGTETDSPDTAGRPSQPAETSTRSTALSSGAATGERGGSTAGGRARSASSRASAARALAEAVPASTTGRMTSASASGSRTSSAEIGALRSPAVTSGVDQQGDRRDPGAACGEREQPAGAQPAGAADAAPRELVAGVGDGRDGPLAGLPHHQLVGHLRGLDDALGEAGPRVDAALLTASGADPGDHMGEEADRARGRDDQADPEVEQGGQAHGERGDEEQPPDGHPAAQLAVEDAVDVVDDRGQHVATARAEPPGGERDQRVVHLGAAARRACRGRTSCERTPLDVAEHGAGQAERPDQRRSRRAGSAPRDGSTPAR